MSTAKGVYDRITIAWFGSVSFDAPNPSTLMFSNLSYRGIRVLVLLLAAIFSLLIWTPFHISPLLVFVTSLAIKDISVR
jgi:hypothetical protein